MEWQKQLGLLRTSVAALGTRRLVALGVTAMAVLAAVAAIASYAARPETEPLYTGLNQADVARIGAALNDAGIPYDVGADATKVYVRRAQAPRARMLLAERGLPAGSTTGYELFDKLGPFGLTSFMQDITRTRALQGELARTIQTIKGISSARVHVVLPSGSSLRRNQDKASATVVIRAEAAERTSQTAQIIRHLVSSAVPGLAPENVSVMSADGAVLAAGGDQTNIASVRMLELEQAVARQAQNNVRATLTPYLGVDNFEVSVTARVNLDKRQQSEQAFDPDAKAPRSARVVKESGSAQNANGRQAVTVEQNIPNEQPNAGGDTQSRKSNERREETTNYELTSKSSVVSSEGHRIESLQVSLVVNRQRLAGDADVERRLKEIEAIASAAAGLDQKRGDKISVAAVEFIAAATEPSGTPMWSEWLSRHLDTMIISLTAVAALTILIWVGLLPSVRAIIANTSQAQDGGALVEAAGMIAATAPSTPAIVPADGAATLAPSSRANPVQARLAELIEQDEKQVADILKQWLVKA